MQQCTPVVLLGWYEVIIAHQTNQPMPLPEIAFAEAGFADCVLYNGVRSVPNCLRHLFAVDCISLWVPDPKVTHWIPQCCISVCDVVHSHVMQDLPYHRILLASYFVSMILVLVESISGQQQRWIEPASDFFRHGCLSILHPNPQQSVILCHLQSFYWFHMLDRKTLE